MRWRQESPVKEGRSAAAVRAAWLEQVQKLSGVRVADALNRNAAANACSASSWPFSNHAK